MIYLSDNLFNFKEIDILKFNKNKRLLNKIKILKIKSVLFKMI